ncbi:MAG: triose-phosphate isomerase [Clostridia bacterium]|nr:triose-phosphate isomerase [Clostridia bacterium]
MRKPIIAGNWKMNKTAAETKAMITELAPLVKDADCDVVLCVPFTDLQAAKRAAKGTNIKIGAQNVHWAEKGAYTGEISAEMLKELKVDYVIIGHSERRQYFGETDETVNMRVQAALDAKLRPIVCVGETEDERENGLTVKVLERQISVGLRGFKSKDFERMVIAYEPVWAIGTGKTATAEDADETIAAIRKIIMRHFHKTIAPKVRIQYGGSMNVKNCKELMAKENIDGGLIGGASLKVKDFAEIVNYNK